MPVLKDDEVLVEQLEPQASFHSSLESIPAADAKMGLRGTYVADSSPFEGRRKQSHTVELQQSGCGPTQSDVWTCHG